MKTLTTSEAVALWTWAAANHSKNWGTWTDYPVGGCSYLQFDNNQLVVKFDRTVSYQGETLKRIGWGRNIPGKEKAITFAGLYQLIPESDRPAKEQAPTHEFTHPNGTVFVLRQQPYADYPKHEMIARLP